MKRSHTLSLLLMACYVYAQTLEQSSLTATAVVHGYWISQGPKNILGQGSDTLLRFHTDADGLSLTRIVVHYPSVNDRTSPTVQTNGPFRVTCGTNELRYADGEKEQKYTFRIENNALVLPAFISIDERSWRFQSPQRTGTFQCEFNPTKRESGVANFPSVKWDGIKQYYISSSNGESRRLDFQVELNNGQLNTACSLVWDKYGFPRFDGSSWYHDFKEERFVPLTEEDFVMRTTVSNNGLLRTGDPRTARQSAEP